MSSCFFAPGGSIEFARFLLQDRDPRAFQLMLQTPEGATFLGSTPELLYKRCGSRVASEAVAATRPRGPPGETDPLH